jgi:hypothetical protein
MPTSSSSSRLHGGIKVRQVGGRRRGSRRSGRRWRQAGPPPAAMGRAALAAAAARLAAHLRASGPLSCSSRSFSMSASSLSRCKRQAAKAGSGPRGGGSATSGLPGALVPSTRLQPPSHLAADTDELAHGHAERAGHQARHPGQNHRLHKGGPATAGAGRQRRARRARRARRTRRGGRAAAAACRGRAGPPAAPRCWRRRRALGPRWTPGLRVRSRCAAGQWRRRPRGSRGGEQPRTPGPGALTVVGPQHERSQQWRAVRVVHVLVLLQRAAACCGGVPELLQPALLRVGAQAVPPLRRLLGIGVVRAAAHRRCGSRSTGVGACGWGARAAHSALAGAAAAAGADGNPGAGAVGLSCSRARWVSGGRGGVPRWAVSVSGRSGALGHPSPAAIRPPLLQRSALPGAIPVGSLA